MDVKRSRDTAFSPSYLAEVRRGTYAPYTTIVPFAEGCEVLVSRDGTSHPPAWVLENGRGDGYAFGRFIPIDLTPSRLRDQPAAYWKRQYKEAEKAKMLACGYADQAEARLRKAREAAASELADVRDSLTWVRKLHRPSGVAVCQECGKDWPCATIRAVGDSV